MEVINLDDSVDTNSVTSVNTSTSIRLLRKRKQKSKIIKKSGREVTDSDSTISPSSFLNSALNLGRKTKKKRKVRKKRLSIVIVDSDDEPIVTKEENKKCCGTGSEVIEISDSEEEGVVSGLIEISERRNWKNNQNITCNIITSHNSTNNNTSKSDHNRSRNNNNKQVERPIPLKNILLPKNNDNVNTAESNVSQENASSSIKLLKSLGNISVSNTQLPNSNLSATSNNKSSRSSISYQPEETKINKNGPRPIIIDGSNVAFGHGKERFSAKGIQICIEYFIRRNHKEIRAFLPQFRRRHPTTIGFHILDKLEKDDHLIYTPSRTVDKRRITSYDDRFIVEYAAKTGGIIVTRDTYKDLLEENPSWSDTINYRLLQYTFVGDMIMFPQDPLGQGGPTLERFLMY